ncbi:MAG: hypothetical protein WBD07_08450, partial [Vicinamibacterales bacterium]
MTLLVLLAATAGAWIVTPHFGLFTSDRLHLRIIAAHTRRRLLSTPRPECGFLGHGCRAAATAAEGG